MLGAIVKTLMLSATLFVPNNARLDGSHSQKEAKHPPCQSVKIFRYTAADYKAMSRDKLTAMGKDGHPVGLYYMSQKALQSGQRQRAKSLLLRAAQAGLTQAYQQLSELEKHDGNRALSHHYKRCAQTQL